MILCLTPTFFLDLESLDISSMLLAGTVAGKVWLEDEAVMK